MNRAVHPPFLAGRLLVFKAVSLFPYFKRNLPVFKNNQFSNAKIIVYATDMRKNSLFSLAYCILRKMRKLRMCLRTIYAQDSLPMRNIYARFAQDYTYCPMRNICARLYLFSNAQYMRKICARLYFFPQCTIYAQDLRKIILFSPMRNICTRFVQDCTSPPMCKDCRHCWKKCHISHICSKFRMVFTS